MFWSWPPNKVGEDEKVRLMMLSMMNVGRWPAILLREDEHLLQLASGLHSQVEAQQETFS